MASVSIGKAWEEANAFVKREAGLLFPVALLMISMPIAMVFQLIPLDIRKAFVATAGGKIPAAPLVLPSSVAFGAIFAAIIGMIGVLTIYALALRPGISVAESLRLAVRRTPVQMGVSALTFIGLITVMIAASVVPEAVGRVLLLAGLLFVSVRFLLSNAVIVDRNLGVIGSIVACWHLTRGHFLRLGAYLLVSAVVMTLAQVVAEMLFGLVGFAIGGASGGQAAADTGLALMFGVAQVYFAVMAVRIYRQISE